MKTIRGSWEDVVKITCLCCPEDSDYMKLYRNKYYHADSEKIAYYFSFKYNNEFSLKDRIKQYRRIKKNISSFRTGKDQCSSGFPINFDQLEEFWTTLYNDALSNDILDEKDIEYIDKKNDISTKEFFIDDEWILVLIHKTLDGLIVDADIYKNKEKEEKQILDFGLGWAISKKEDEKQFIKRAKKYIFDKKRNYYMTRYDGFLYKEDLVEFLASINAFIKKIKIDEKNYKHLSLEG